MWIRAALAYPASFWMTMLGNLGASGMDFVIIIVMFLHTHALGGWSLPQVAFLYGTSGLTLGLADLFVGSLDQLGVRVREGSVDTILVRPVPALAQLAGDRFALRRIGRVAQSGAVLVWSLVQLDLAWTPLKALVFVSLLLSGTLIFGSVFVGGSAFHFFMADAAEVQNSFTYGGATMLQYPPTIYARDIVRGTVFGVPLAFVNWLPALYLLGRNDPLGLPSWFRFASPVAALLCVAAAGLLWRTGVRSYRSTGS
ncbi:transporter [Streptacidiphilus pinicola]|uniref:Transporter n=1 Tax=Streptacidiphilus pinicola TaxID=2219663 RepID=A0A2X0J137_9ACTN|nr:ABC transporter permease [Streptacidiphilus pinicola]RAG81038.1 transporter [Streptacidiphilus pinicola]